VDKPVPVDISNVATATRTHETHGNDGSFLPVVVNKLPFCQQPAMDEHPRAD
jgi:hypothetical protein